MESSGDKDLLAWWAQYNESNGNYDTALNFYEQAEVLSKLCPGGILVVQQASWSRVPQLLPSCLLLFPVFDFLSSPLAIHPPNHSPSARDVQPLRGFQGVLIGLAGGRAFAPEAHSLGTC